MKKHSKRILALLLSVLVLVGSSLTVFAGSVSKISNTINGVYYSGGVQIVSSSRVQAFMDANDSTVYTYASGKIYTPFGSVALDLKAMGYGGFYYTYSTEDAYHGSVSFFGDGYYLGSASPYV
jgi:hypothetical protein